ncbi:HAD family hydrolase [Imhoffiella purpurea]|uniref:HAD-superfamily hydrolase subfamily IA, variant 3 n=1 Tax=Imhoffiella purpurea TaxID=1249627 RepID=W9UVG1_9GAMM|nr:HAD family hydrolase [Imhoffiella purpurea]EXJ11228.1 HAD-superfamily hydrolase subfamily IA, variant 3 [Imhoffiella purpurea]
MSRSRIRLITFDLDDTLWPCLPAIQAAEQVLHGWLRDKAPRLAEAHDIESMRAHRRTVMESMPEIAHDLGLVRHRSLIQLLESFDYPADLADAAVSLFLEHRSRVEPYPDALPVLRALAPDYRLVSLTNGNADVEVTSLRGIFAHNLTAAGIGAAKPDPAMFRRALELTGCDTDECLHLGDDPWTDVEAARAFGIPAIWVNRTGRDWPETLEPPSLTVTHLYELTAWLKDGRTGDDDGI